MDPLLPLLELGLGIQPELTGRENAVHAAGLMGVPQSLIRAIASRDRGLRRNRRVL